ncbi:hypothetical protein COO60DRAFT_282105 [Scenedesmus sp. NREL 46B-D3]|nr:hypothetical protein COO60DRAFT_282105 [Scenedesmus sp. NREL 46B-D3]
MFKISLLQAASGKQQQQQSASDAKPQRCHLPLNRLPRQQAAGSLLSISRSSQQQQLQQGSLLSTALEWRGWTLQAAAVTDDLGCDASRFKSLAVYAEVKLAEALDKAAKASPVALNEDGEPLPNSLKTAVCCQLLGELAEFCGPFSSTLLRLRNELLPAVYSSYAATQAGMPLSFDQMPWFMVAGQLQDQNQALLQQQEAFTAELGKHQAQMVVVEQQLLAFKAAMDAGEAAASKLQATNAGLVAAHDSALEESAAAADEAKRLAAEVARLKDELGETHEQLSNAKEVAAQDMEQWQGQLEAFKKQLHVEKQQGEAAVEMAAARLTAADGQELEARCLEAERRLEEAEQRLAALATASSSSRSAEALQQQQLLTPRPTEGVEAQALADSCKATCKTLEQLLQQHTATMSAMQRQLQLLQAASRPDTAPQPWRLNVRTEASSYFITEGALNPSDEVSGKPSRPKVFAEPLGLGPGVPKFLRWDEPVELTEVALQELQQQVSSIWQGKAAHEALHGPCHLQEYLYYRFVASAAAGSTVVPVMDGCAGEEGKGDNSSKPKDMDDVCNSTEGLATDKAAGAAAAAGYLLYYALGRHRQASVAVDTMWQVLTGQLPESVLLEQQLQLQSLLAALEVLQQAATGAAATDSAATGTAAAAEGSLVNAEITAAEDGTTDVVVIRLGRGETPGLRMSDMQTALQLLYPCKPQQRLADIAACLEAACGGSSTCSSSSTRSTGHGAVMIQAQQLAVVVHAVRQAAGSIRCSSPQGPAGTPAQAAAAAAVVECILRQQLQEVLTHTQQTMQQVHQLLTQLGVPADGACAAVAQHPLPQSLSAELPEGRIMQRLAALLLSDVTCSGSSSSSSSKLDNPAGGIRQASMNGRQQPTAAMSVAELGSRLGSMGGNGRYGSRTGSAAEAAGAETPLTAAAASVGRPMPAGGSSSQRRRGGDLGAAAAAGTGTASSPGSCSCSVYRWLAAVQQCQAADCNGMRGVEVSVQQLLCWLQRECLLQPASCKQDEAAAVHWCRTAMRC